MTIQEIIPLALTASIFLLVFSLGLHATIDDALSLFRRPSLLFRSILSMNLIMLAVAVAAGLIFNLHPAVKVALIALAVSPVPPILPGKQQKAGGSASFSIGLLCAASLVAIVLVPLAISVVGEIFDRHLTVPIGRVIRVVAITIIAPLAVGILVRRFAPALAERIAKPVSILAWVVLIAALVPVLVTMWPGFEAMVGTSGIIVSLVGFTVIGTIVGHLLGGPDPDDRTVLALATGARHPGIAMAAASGTMQAPSTVMMILIAHLIIATLVVLPYVIARTRAHAGGAPT